LHYLRGVRAIGNPADDPNGAQLLGCYVADPGAQIGRSKRTSLE
jgi:hypothetical protein